MSLVGQFRKSALEGTRPARRLADRIRLVEGDGQTVSNRGHAAVDREVRTCDEARFVRRALPVHPDNRTYAERGQTCQKRKLLHLASWSFHPSAFRPTESPVRWSSMLLATSSQNDGNSSSSFVTKASSVCSASFRYMAAWPRKESGQSCMPNTVPLSLES